MILVMIILFATVISIAFAITMTMMTSMMTIIMVACKYICRFQVAVQLRHRSLKLGLTQLFSATATLNCLAFVPLGTRQGLAAVNAAEISACQGSKQETKLTRNKFLAPPPANL